MAKCHIYSNFRLLKSIPNGQKTATNKISHAPYRYTLYTMLLDDITLNAKQYESKENFDLGF